MDAIEIIALLNYYKKKGLSGGGCQNQSQRDAQKYAKALEEMLKNKTEEILKTE